MNTNKSDIRYVIGRLDAIELLTTNLVLQLQPELARMFVARCNRMRAEASPGDAQDLQDLGFLSVERTLLEQAQSLGIPHAAIHPARTPGQDG